MNKRSWTVGFVLLAGFLALAGGAQSAGAADTTPPTGTIVINNNRSATNSANVTLKLSWDDGPDGSGVVRMRFSDDGAHWSAWEPLAATKAYPLPSGDGHKTVRVQYLDKTNNRSITYSDYIRLDTTLPTGTILINDGMAATPIQSVKLAVTWTDGTGAGVSRMRFSDDGAHWTIWETPSTIRWYTLPAGTGNRTVRVQFLDGAGNYSVAYNDYIKRVAVTEETVMLPGDVPLVTVWVPGGTYLMGRYAGEQDSWPPEDPQHSVTVGGFWMGKDEVTKRQWQAVMGTTPWAGQTWVLDDPESPAVYVSHYDAQAFFEILNSGRGKTYRLPSEAEWEYACRARTTTRYYWGDDPSYAAIDDYAWNEHQCYYDKYAHLVGQKLPNAFGLYDMSGNVLEWCLDLFHDNYNGAPTDGSAWMSSSIYTGKSIRGGCWSYPVYHDCSAFRDYAEPGSKSYNCGFRVVRNQ